MFQVKLHARTDCKSVRAWLNHILENENYILVVIINLLFGCLDRSIYEGVTYFFYSKKAPNSSVTDFYIVVKSESYNNKRTDTFYNYVYENGQYKYAFCNQKYYFIKNDSLLMIDSDVKGEFFKTKFVENECDTTITNDQLFSKEINCYLGNKTINFDGKKINAHYIKTIIEGGDGSISMDTYYDKNMHIILENGDIPFGFGKYELRRVTKIPFHIVKNQNCQ